MRIDPPVSEPIATSTSPVATATALPPEEPPAVRSGSYGLRIRPAAEVVPRPLPANSSRFVFAVIVAPASRSRRTTVASSAGTKSRITSEPAPIGTPPTAIASLIPTSTPSSGPESTGRTSHRVTIAFEGVSSGCHQTGRLSWVDLARVGRTWMSSAPSSSVATVSRTSRSSSSRIRRSSSSARRRTSASDSSPRPVVTPDHSSCPIPPARIGSLAGVEASHEGLRFLAYRSYWLGTSVVPGGTVYPIR